MTQGSSPILCKPRAAEISRGMAWLSEGFGYFQKDILAWVGVTILLFVFIIALAFIPLLGNLAIEVLMPIFIAGLMLGCQARAQGEKFQVVHLFAGFSQHTGQLMILGLLYLAGIIAIAILIVILVIVGAGDTAIMAELEAGDIAALTDNRKFLLLIALIVAALYVPLLMAYWFAPALVILRKAGAIDAIKLSFTGCLMNIMPFILYGLIGLVLSIVAIIPMGLGLLVLIPVVTASIYVAYQDIYSDN